MAELHSRLVLGTVQLGMPYGINNTHGQPSREEAFEILDLAWKSGIDIFDTSFAYGNAESLLGEWMRSRNNAGTANIVTKAKGDAAAVRAQIRQSLISLGLERLHGVLLHVTEDTYANGAVEVLSAAKKKGEVIHTGISVYTPQEAHDALGRGFDHIQVPFNVFDRRFDVSGFFSRAKGEGMTIFARSPSLQGLLFMSPTSIPPSLTAARPFVEKFRDIAASCGLTPIEAAMMYPLAHARVDHVVFGVECVSQLEQIVRAAKVRPHAQCLARLHDAFPDIDVSIVDPSLWK